MHASPIPTQSLCVISTNSCTGLNTVSWTTAFKLQRAKDYLIPVSCNVLDKRVVFTCEWFFDFTRKIIKKATLVTSTILYKYLIL